MTTGVNSKEKDRYYLYGLAPPKEPVVVRTKDEHGLPLNVAERTALLLKKLDRVDVFDKKEYSLRVPCFLRLDQDVQQQRAIMHEVKEYFLSSNIDTRLVALQEEQVATLKEERQHFDQAHNMYVEMLKQEQGALASSKTVHGANHDNRKLSQ